MVADMTTTPVVIQSLGERVRAINALYALIAFLELHPDLPAPTSIDARYHVHGGTAGARADHVADAAQTMGVEAERSDPYVRAATDFAEKDGFGSLGFRYSVITHTNDGAGF